VLVAAAVQIPPVVAVGTQQENMQLHQDKY
jgi:hypothetical protein